MLWFLKDRSLNVTEAALQIRRYNAWRVENGYDNVSFESVESEFNTGKALLLDQRDLLGRARRTLLATSQGTEVTWMYDLVGIACHVIGCHSTPLNRRGYKVSWVTW